MIDNVIQLNDDCLMLILKSLNNTELCAVAETCQHLKSVAGEVFKHRLLDMHRGTFKIPQNGIDFLGHQRLLKNFGHLITSVSCFIKFGDHVSANTEEQAIHEHQQVIAAFKWLQTFQTHCADSLERLTILSEDVSAVQQTHQFANISDQMLKSCLLNCNKLVELDLGEYEGPYHLQNYHFPNLLKFSNQVYLSGQNDCNNIETFFQHHTKLTELKTYFLIGDGDSVIDFSFVKHLPALKKLHFTLSESPITGTEAFGYLANLQEFLIDGSREKMTDIMLFKALSSVDSLKTLILLFPEVDHLIVGIERFKNLSKLKIVSSFIDMFDALKDANISALAQLRDSSLTELEVDCNNLLHPESIVEVIRNLTKITKLTLRCEVELTENIGIALAKVCSSQNRRLIVILDEDLIDGMDFGYVEEFNKKYCDIVEIKIEA